MTLADQQDFRDVIGRFASGVTIITTTVDGAPFGTRGPTLFLADEVPEGCALDRGLGR